MLFLLYFVHFYYFKSFIFRFCLHNVPFCQFIHRCYLYTEQGFGQDSLCYLLPVIFSVCEPEFPSKHQNCFGVCDVGVLLALHCSEELEKSSSSPSSFFSPTISDRDKAEADIIYKPGCCGLWSGLWQGSGRSGTESLQRTIGFAVNIFW